jgi:cell division protein FtsB
MTATPQRFAMQQPIQTRGSTAPQLDQAAPWQPVIRSTDLTTEDTGRDQRSTQRTPLALVPAPRRKSGRGFVALCIGILVAALLLVLVTNITVSNGQYELVSLKNEQLDLNQSNERLRQQVEHLEAPQNLAAEASRLGMVNPGSIAAIDLATGTVNGISTPADAEDKPSGRVAAPTSPEEKQAEAAQPASGSAEDTAHDSAGQQPEVEVPQPAAANGTTTEDDAAGQQASDPQDLNGGTIPAPQFAASGN